MSLRADDGLLLRKDDFLSLQQADAIIYSAATSHEAELITSDQHLKSLEGVKLIE